MQVYADPAGRRGEPVIADLDRLRAIPGAVNAFRFTGPLPGDRPLGDFTLRVNPVARRRDRAPRARAIL